MRKSCCLQSQNIVLSDYKKNSLSSLNNVLFFDPWGLLQRRKNFKWTFCRAIDRVGINHNSFLVPIGRHRRSWVKFPGRFPPPPQKSLGKAPTSLARKCEDWRMAQRDYLLNSRARARCCCILANLARLACLAHRFRHVQIARLSIYLLAILNATQNSSNCTISLLFCFTFLLIFLSLSLIHPLTFNSIIYTVDNQLRNLNALLLREHHVKSL